MWGWFEQLDHKNNVSYTLNILKIIIFLWTKQTKTSINL